MIWEAELSDLTTSAYIPRTAYMYRSTGNASSMHVWLAGYPDILLPLWNAKSQILSLVCALRNSKCAIQMIIQIMLFALVWKRSKCLNQIWNSHSENSCVPACMTSDFYRILLHRKKTFYHHGNVIVKSSRLWFLKIQIFRNIWF